MKILRLHLKNEYFDQVVTGEKLDEFRLVNLFWSKMLVDKRYDFVLLYRGYPRAGEYEKMRCFVWDGVKVQWLRHKHFGPDEVRVFAISLRKPMKQQGLMLLDLLDMKV